MRLLYRSFAGPKLPFWLTALLTVSSADAVLAGEGDSKAAVASPAGGVRLASLYSPPAPAPVPAQPQPVPRLTFSPPAPGSLVMERDEDAPLAGYTNNAPFIRSRDSNFVLFPSGRLNVDGFFFLNRGDPAPGVTPDGANDQRPRHTIFLRRARAEIMGTILKHFDYMLAGEFATTPTGAQTATATDVFVNINYTPWANIQIGQFDAPFTLENRIVDKYIDFMERSIAVRAFGIPTNKELGLMLTGLAPRKFLHYEFGVFNGDGIDVRNLDNHFDFMGRAYFAPLSLLPRAKDLRWLSDIWVGGSIWYGHRVDVSYVAPNLTTQGGVTLLPSTFTSSGQNLQVVPNGDVLKWAVEVNVPIGPIGWRFELIHTDRENMGLYRPPAMGEMAPDLGRILAGTLNRSGTALYVQMWYWILGSPSMLPTPGQEVPLRWAGYRKGKESWPVGLYVSARYERLTLKQEDTTDTSTMMLTDPEKVVFGNLSVDSFGLAVNAWFTRHMRFSVNYLMNYLDGDMPLIGGGGIALPTPNGTGQPTSMFFRTAEHELLFRAQFGL